MGSLHHVSQGPCVDLRQGEHLQCKGADEGNDPRPHAKWISAVCALDDRNHESTDGRIFDVAELKGKLLS